MLDFPFYFYSFWLYSIRDKGTKQLGVVCLITYPFILYPSIIMAIINLLTSEFYNWSTIEQAIEFITRCYDEIPSTKQIEKAKQIIKQCTWKDRN